MPSVCLYPILSTHGKANMYNHSKYSHTKLILILSTIELSASTHSIAFTVSLFSQFKDLSNYCNCKNISTLEHRWAMQLINRLQAHSVKMKYVMGSK